MNRIQGESDAVYLERLMNLSTEGLTDVQIALLTAKINALTARLHRKFHPAIHIPPHCILTFNYLSSEDYFVF
jgi:hypothetical protein